jgi:intein/homing endonuclease
MKDSEKPFYQRLTQLFRSGPSIRRKVTGQNTKAYYDKSVVQTNLGYYGGNGYKRESSPFSVLGSYGLIDRIARYSEFVEMQYQPEINTALDVYADETTSGDEKGNCFHVFSNNRDIQRILEELFYGTMNIEGDLRRWVRNMITYGDFFLYLEVQPDVGVFHVEPIMVSNIERQQFFDPEDPYAVRFKLIQSNKILENWQVAHFRIVNNDLMMPYGTSLLEPVRRTWRVLSMLEDAMLLYRIVRCLHGESIVWTDNGCKKIKDVKIGDKVYSYDFQKDSYILSEVTDWVNNGKQKIWEIKTKHRSLKANESHPILVRDNLTGVTDYVQVKDLIVKRHEIISPKISSEAKTPINFKQENYEWFGILTEEGKQEFLKTSSNRSESIRLLSSKYKIAENRIQQFLYTKNRMKGLPIALAEDLLKVFNLNKEFLKKYPKGMGDVEKLNLPEFVNEEFARFFGFMIGDGYIAKNMHRIGFATGVHPENNKYYFDLFKKYCSKATFTQDKRNKNQELGWVQASSFYLCHLMCDMGYIPGAHNKRVPQWVFNSSDSIKEAFIDGLVDADGHTRILANTESSVLKMCNKALLEDVKELCHQLGWAVSSKISEKTEKARFIQNKQFIKETKGYCLYFTKVQHGIYEKIFKVSETEEESDVFDITVNNPLHNFIANGCVVHNSAERRVFYIDTTGVHPNDIGTYMETVIESMKGKDVIDKMSGRVDLRYNPMTVLDDYYLPVTKESKTKIDTLPGGQHVSAVEDVEYMQKKLIAGLKVPKAYLTYTEDLSSKAGLAMEDVRFSRTITALQRVVISELNKIAILHLYAKGFEGEDLVDFELRLSNPSTIAIQQKLQTWSTKFDIASKAKESGLVDEEWIQEELLGLRQEEILKIRKGKEQDKLRELTLDKMALPKELGPQISPFLSPFDAASQPTALNANGINPPQTPPNQVVQNDLPVRPNSPTREILKVNTSLTKAPVKANMTPTVSGLKRASRPGVDAMGGVGRIDKMIDANNRYTKDIADMEFLKSPLLEARLMEEFDMKIPMGLPGDIRSILECFDKKTTTDRTKFIIEVADKESDPTDIIFEDLFKDATEDPNNE